VIVASQAGTGSGLKLTSKPTASMASTVHPSEKLARISSWETRRGPKPGGNRSLKQSR
jgi:hypothetical protein